MLLPTLTGLFLLMLVLSFAVAAKAMAIQKPASSSAKSKPYVMTKRPTASKTSARTNAAVVTKKVIKKNAKIKSAQTQAVSAAKGLRTVSNGIKPIGASLYVDPSLRNQGRPSRIANQAVATWFGGWNGDVRSDVQSLVSRAANKGKIATLVAYNIPHRDCGLYSAGGTEDSDAYRAWIDEFAKGIGDRKAIVILEPDALPGMDCLPSADQSKRLADISYAVSRLASTKAMTYIDAGNYSWQSASTMADRLKRANVAAARGFSLNVSGYGWTKNTISYGQQLTRAIGSNKGFVMDTSRNGKGPTTTNEWCNPRGRGLGKNPTTSTGTQYLDAYLWIKVPGESDGTCNGGPSAGQWWNDIANELIRNAAQ